MNLLRRWTRIGTDVAMPLRFLRGLTLVVVVVSVVVAANAQDSDALVGVFVRKGLVSNQDIEEARADFARDSAAKAGRIIPAGKSTDRVSIGVLIVAQYAGLATRIQDAADPAMNSHFLVRRTAFSLRAGLGEQWRAVFVYNFAGPNFGAAFAEWTPTPDLKFDFGLRKVSLAYDEYSPSENVRAIENSPVTRYFVEPANGRRLGAASYRIGIFISGKHGAFQYGAAITDPERVEDLSTISSAGNGTNNQPAFWGNMGFAGRWEGATYLLGAAVGYLPGQGGPGNTHLGQGYDLSLGTVFADVSTGRIGLQAEYFKAEVQGGASLTRDAAPSGFYIQPSFKLTSTVEAVVRYSSLDSDGRGVDLADAVRSAPSSGLMDSLKEWYVGGNWYIKHNDLKMSLGFLHAVAKNASQALPAKAQTNGLRSQMQVAF